jgi:C-terminal processing protease CtpA/Prc
LRQEDRAANTILTMKDTQGRAIQFSLPATCGVRYLPRLPVPISGINDSGSVCWKMLDDQIGYIYVRRIRSDLIPLLDRAVSQLQNARGLVIDVRGNSGGGFDGRRAHLNFALDRDGEEPDRPRFKGPIALLIDARCISAGEGWASWFVANDRARVFGEATAGASGRKIVYTLKNGLFRVRFPVKLYKGYLRRPLERIGLTPDTPLKQNAKDLAKGRDTVLEAAREYLVDLLDKS